MLNPSTADARSDDPTIRRCISFSRKWGATRMTVVNLFNWRCSDPRDLREVEDPVGPQPFADRLLLKSIRKCTHVVLGWGTHGKLNERNREVFALLKRNAVPVKCLGRSKDGHPLHPLYLASRTELRMYEYEVDRV
jgi:hypothetical protein